MSKKGSYLNNFNLKKIYPLTVRQELVLNSDKNLVLSGYAGTGKTLLASYLGYKGLLKREYNNVVYIRSAVPTRNIGYLPGSVEEKVEAYEAPYMDIAIELFNRGDAYENFKHKEDVLFMPTSFLRGINLSGSFIIVDECQNMSYHELDTIITRLKDDCRIIFCGDVRQPDLEKNGARDFYKVLKAMPEEFDFIEFQKEDIVRSPLVKKYIITKDELLHNSI